MFKITALAAILAKIQNGSITSTNHNKLG